MADDDIFDKDTEEDEQQEYQFNDDDDLNYDDDFTSHAENADEAETINETDKPQSKVSRKRIIISIIVLIVVVFIIYKLFSWMFGSKKKTTPPMEAPAISAQPIAIKEKVQTSSVLADQSAFKTPKTPVMEQSGTVQLQKDFDAMVSNTKQVNQRLLQAGQHSQQVLVDLQNKQEVNQAQLTTLTNRMNSLEEHLGDIQDSIQGIAAQIKANQVSQLLLDTYKAKLQDKQNRAIRRKKQYFVEAVIPGRAWLQAADGTDITVAVGDTIAGYGKVIMINPYNGVVRTDSGETIHYAVNE